MRLPAQLVIDYPLSKDTEILTDNVEDKDQRSFPLSKDSKSSTHAWFHLDYYCSKFS